LRALVVRVVRVYQRVAPPRLRRACRFAPTCSDYTIAAIEKYGAISGILKGFGRFSRCRPPHGGVDQP